MSGAFSVDWVEGESGWAAVSDALASESDESFLADEFLNAHSFDEVELRWAAFSDASVANLSES